MTNDSRHISIALPDLRVSRRSSTMNRSAVPMGQDLLPSDPRFWDQPTPENCDTVRMLRARFYLSQERHPFIVAGYTNVSAAS